MIERFSYDETSFSCLRWIDGQMSGEDAGYKVYRDNGKPKTIKVTIGAKGYRCHRIIWEMFNGKIPTGMVVDHIDRNPFNNRISNLRLITVSENNRNRSKTATCKTGVTGVYSYMTKGSKRYVARWSIDGEDHERHFAVGKRTDAEAFEQACQHRERMIEQLNNSGANYSQTHGMWKHLDHLPKTLKNRAKREKAKKAKLAKLSQS